MIAIIDYGAGNLQSVKKALDFIGADSEITSDIEKIKSASHVILPGVGSFGDAMDCINSSGLFDGIKEVALSGKPFLGICLGLQLLFENSEESPNVCGLGILKGTVKKFPADMGLKVPHMGWNSIKIENSNGLFNNITDGSYIYFVHSYYLQAGDKNDVSAITDYGIDFACAVQRGTICATQFHPEKSSDVGLQILRNFVAMRGQENAR